MPGSGKSDVKESGRYWDHRNGCSPALWMAHREVRSYVNESVTGDAGRWPLDWFQEEFASEPFARALSVGCGKGALERDLVAKNLCRAVDAFDGSIGSLDAALRAAKDQALDDRIRYFAADFNQVVLPRETYDVVFCHQSLHHVAKLEKLLRQILRAVKPQGLVFIDEYLGPSRHEWTASELSFQDQVYRTVVPEKARKFARLPAPIVPADPSEAIRSSEIEKQLALGFDVVLKKEYGGNLLWMLCPQIDWEEVDFDLVPRLIRAEKEYLARGYPSHFAVMIAAPKTGRRAQMASLRYFLEPKLRRLLRDLVKPLVRPVAGAHRGGLWRDPG